MANDNQGNLGIGTTSPNYKLHVIGEIFANGDITSTSDLRLKTNVESINLSDEKISKLKNLRGVSFKRKNNDDIHLGFIAQEIEQVIPEVVYTDPKSGYKSIAYGNISAVLFEYIKYLHDGINEQKTIINELKNKIENIEKNIK